MRYAPPASMQTTGPAHVAVALALLSCSRGGPLTDGPTADAGATRGIPPAALGARIAPAPAVDDAEATPNSPAFVAPPYGPVPFSGTPKIREGALSLSSAALSRDVAQRVLRRAFARVRLCYETGLRGNPTLAGTIRVRFVVDGDGALGAVTDAGSSLPEPAVVSCVLTAFDGLQLPPPSTSGIVGVYTIYLEPSPP